MATSVAMNRVALEMPFSLEVAMEGSGNLVPIDVYRGAES